MSDTIRKRHSDRKHARADAQRDARPLYVDLRPYLEANLNYFDTLRDLYTSQGAPDDARDVSRIIDFSCRYFGHPTFTADTYKRLDIFLRSRSQPGTDIYGLPLKLVANILEAECERKGVRERQAAPAPPLTKPPHTDGPNGGSSTARPLTETQRRILALCRQKAYKGDTIASKMGLDYDYTRKLLAGLVKSGRLRNDDKGYRKTM